MTVWLLAVSLAMAGRDVVVEVPTELPAGRHLSLRHRRTHPRQPAATHHEAALLENATVTCETQRRTTVVRVDVDGPIPRPGRVTWTCPLEGDALQGTLVLAPLGLLTRRAQRAYGSLGFTGPAPADP